MKTYEVIRDCVDRGALTEADLPDDFQALQVALSQDADIVEDMRIVVLRLLRGERPSRDVINLLAKDLGLER